MKISSIQNNGELRYNSFIRYANSLMSRINEEPEEQTKISGTSDKKLNKSMGLETLTIFPKEVINGKTIITA